MCVQKAFLRESLFRNPMEKIAGTDSVSDFIV